MKLIGIAGKAKSGKTTVGNYLMGKYGLLSYAFADPLKQAAQHMFGLTHDQVHDGKLKEEVIPHWGKSPRQLLQLLGTDAAHTVFGKDIWVRRAELFLAQLAEDMVSINAQGHGKYEVRAVVFTDVRFETEANWIREKGGAVLHLRRIGADPVSAHKSEDGITFDFRDHLITNNGSLADLYAHVDRFMEVLNGEHDADLPE